MARTVYNAPNPFNQSLNSTDDVSFGIGILQNNGGLGQAQLIASNDTLHLEAGLGGALDIQSDSWIIGGKQAGAVVLDAGNFVNINVNGSPVKLLIAS